MFKYKKKILLITSFFFIAILSSYFRIQNLELIEFKADEAINLFLASRPVFGHPFVPIGIISSIGIPNPPFFNYLLLPFLILSTDPKAISFMIGGINSLAIGFLFLIIYRYYGFPTAFFTSILIALSPWSILFSRKIWPPDFILPFMVGIIFLIHKIIVDKKEFYWLPLTILIALLIQLYYPTVIFVILLVIFMIVQKIKPNLKLVFIGLLIGVIPLMPYFIYEIQTGCKDCYSFFAVKEKFATQFNAEIFARPFQITGQGSFQFIIGTKDMIAFSNNYPFVFEFRKILYIPYLLLPIGIFLFWKKYKKFRFLVYATLIMPVIFYFMRLEPFMHYFAILIPILFLYLGIAFTAFYSMKNIPAKIISIVAFTLIIISFYLFNNVFFDILKNQKILSGDYGTAFYSFEKSTKKKFEKLKDDKKYNEMIVASYVNSQTIAESPTLANALYDLETTKNNVSKLEQRLSEIPLDSTVKNELLAYYTSLPKNPKTMDHIRKKALENNNYIDIYEEIYNQYLAQNLKNAYIGNNFSLEYPRHWKKTDLTWGGVLLKTDSYYMVVSHHDPDIKDLENLLRDDKNIEKTYKTTTVNILDQDIHRKECFFDKNLWCGVFYDLINIRGDTIIIFYQSEYANSTPPSKDDRKLNLTIDEMDKVVNTIRPASL